MDVMDVINLTVYVRDLWIFQHQYNDDDDYKFDGLGLGAVDAWMPWSSVTTAKLSHKVFTNGNEAAILSIHTWILLQRLVGCTLCRLTTDL